MRTIILTVCVRAKTSASLQLPALLSAPSYTRGSSQSTGSGASMVGLGSSRSIGARCKPPADVSRNRARRRALRLQRAALHAAGTNSTTPGRPASRTTPGSTADGTQTLSARLQQPLLGLTISNFRASRECQPMMTLAAYQWKSRAIPTVAVAGRGTRRHSADRTWPPVERSDVETRRTRWPPEAGRDNNGQESRHRRSPVHRCL